MRVEVCHLTSAHPRNDTRIFYKQCRSLARAGYRTHLVVADGKGDDECDEVSIHDVGRTASRWGRFFVGGIRMHRKAKAINAAIYHFHDPDLFFVGVRLALHGYKVIYDIHEDYPKDVHSKRWIPGLFRYPVAWGFVAMNWFAARFFHALVIAWPGINRPYLEHNVTQIGNYPMLEDMKIINRYVDRHQMVVMTGAISRIRSAREIVTACSLIKGCPGFKLVVAGNADSAEFEILFKEWIKDLPVQHVGWIPLVKVQELISQARAGLAIYYPEPNHLQSEPTKLFEYMAAGIPVITSNFPKYRKLVEDANCGLTVDPTDSEAIASSIRWIMKHPDEAEAMGRRGRSVIEQKFNWNVEEEKLWDLYQQLT